jgi:isopenicillin-N epimerase
MIKDLFLLDPDVIFLNHGSFGACPRVVFDTYQEWQRKLELQPVQFLGKELNGYLLQARNELGTYIHADAMNLVYIPNATHGVNIIARSLHLKAGDEILSTDQEYGACNYTWDFVCKKTGAIYLPQPISLPATHREELAEQFWRGVTPHTKMIYISHIASPTSLIFPIDLICQRARQAGILTLIDGAHAPGQIPLELDGLGVDFYVGNCHKWMMSPKGAGFLFARPEVQELVEPLIVSWGYRSEWPGPQESRFVDYLQWSGTRDPSAALSVPAAIKFMQENNWDEVRETCHNLLSSAIEQIGELSGLPALYPPDEDFYQQMATVPIPNVQDIKVLQERLYNDYKVEVPCIEWKDRHYIRVSVQGYNTQADIDRFIHALKNLLPAMIA